MAVKINNTNPPNGGPVPFNGGTAVVSGTVDELALVSASIEPVNGGATMNPNEAAAFYAAGQTWTFHFPGVQAGARYNLTVEGQNQNGIGSAIITFQVSVRGPLKPKPDGKKPHLATADKEKEV